MGGARNTFVGGITGSANNTGDDNTFVGYNAGNNIMTTSNNTAFGSGVSGSLVGIENTFALGSNATMTSSHAGVLGNVATQKIGGYVNWGTAADGRMNNNVKENVAGLDFILKLRAVSYQTDAQRLNQLLRGDIQEKVSKKGDASNQAAAKQKATYENYLAEKSNIRYTGFIAQEVEAAAKETDFEFSGVVPPSHDKDHYSLRYAEFVVPMVKAMQEQHEIIEEKEGRINTLESEANTLKSEVNTLESNLSQVQSFCLWLFNTCYINISKADK